LARKENPQLFSRIPQQAESDLVTIVAGWIPTNKRLRKLLLNAWPQHFCRVFLRQIPIIQLPQFPDEKYLWREDGKDEDGNPRRDRRDNDGNVDSQVMTPTIKSFLAFRRSVLMIFVGLALIIIIMGAVSEGPQMVQDLVIGRGEEKLTHDDVRSMMTLFRSATGSGQRTELRKHLLKMQMQLLPGPMIIPEECSVVPCCLVNTRMLVVIASIPCTKWRISIKFKTYISSHWLENT